MKKKFLALVLTLAMVLSLVPVTALATGENDPVRTVESDGTNGVKVIKTATPKKNGNGKATIDMEAYVTGTVTTSTQSTPLDIVLVLDQSGSMEDNLKQLKTAATSFINTITADATTHKVDHRIAVVGFASGKNDYQNTELFVGEKQYEYNKLKEADYKKAFQTVTNETGKSNLTKSIGNLDAEGGTHPELGMAMANSIFAANSNSDANGTRQRIVVMFTDGSPGDYSFDNEVADATVAQAYKTKHTYEATVYTVGLISNPSNQVKNFLNKVSSNYPNAQAYEEYIYNPVYAGQLDKNSKYYVETEDGYKKVSYYDGVIVSGWKAGLMEWYTPKTSADDNEEGHTQFYSRQETTAQYNKYYMHTSNAGELNNIFTNIAQDTTHASVVVGDTSEMRDELSNFFVFDGIECNTDGTVTNGVTVKKVAAQGNNNEPEWATTGEDITGNVTVKVNGDKITVTGFDYSSVENCVVKKDGESWKGYKLVLSFNVKPNVDCYDWTDEDYFDTNQAGAGLYYGEGNQTSTVVSTPKNTPEVPVDTYKVTYEWGDIEATSVTDNQYYINGQTAQVNYTTVEKGAAVKGSNDQLYRFNGWSLDGETVIEKSVNIIDSNVTLIPVLTEAYTVTYTDGVEDEVVFTDDVHSNLINGDPTPGFIGTPTRDGYKFTGWEPEVAETVTGNATYTAQWQKLVEGEVVVTITGKNDTVKYDGTEKSVSGYDVTIAQNDGDTTYTKDDFTFSGTAEAQGTDVQTGGYSMGLNAAEFNNTNPQFTNVTFVVEDGKLTIQPRTVKMTSESDTKPWDGTPLTNGTVTVTGDGFVEGQGATYTVTGSQTDVGESDNTFTYTLNDGTTASNYDITTQFGKLTITKKEEVSYTVIFNANGGAWDSGNETVTQPYESSNSLVSRPTNDPTKSGSTFVDWAYKDAGGTFHSIGQNPFMGIRVSTLQQLSGVTGNSVTLYAVWKTEETPDPAGNCTYTIRQHYWKNLNDTDTGDNVSIENLTAQSDATIASLIDGKDKNQDWRGYRYIYDDQQTTVTVPDQESTKLTNGAVLSVSGTVIDLYYYLDSWKDGNTQNPAGDDEKTGGDGIPDYKQILIEYKAHTPLVGEVSREFEIQTLTDGQTAATPTGATATAKTDSVYAFAYWIKGEVDSEKTEAEIENTAICYEKKLSGVTIDPVTGGETYIYTAVFLKDVTGKIEEGKEKPDGIPDAWQCKVTFKVVNGNWNDNTNAEIVTYVTKKNAKGKGSTNGTAKLTARQIPAVGSQPNSGYKTSGSWDKTPSTDLEITKDTVFTYTYDKKSGGSGGSRPTVTIPDDVPTGLNGKDHYAYVVGYPDGMVYPQKNITRAEVATIFFRLLKDETREANMTKSNGYNDMKDGAWYTCAVSTLSKMGIIKGYEDGSFKPDASISRAEFAAIAARFDPDGDKTPATFSDVSSHWAKDEISIAANHGWIKGYEDGSFKPDQKITRAETMTLVNRVLKRLPETKDDLHKDMKTWPDNQNESAWFYLAVQEATNSHYQKLKKDGIHETWESMRETRDWAALEK